MAPSVRIPIPQGSLKCAFKGDVPKVSMVNDASPLYGILKIGYTFQAIELGDGTIMQGLDTYELVAALNEHSNDPNRFLKMEMTLPAETVVVLHPGAHGLIIEDKWGKAILTRIQADSPLKKEIRVGMVVDTVSLGDGYTITGHTAMEINEALNSADESSRTLILKSPASDLSPRSGSLPTGRRIPIPMGTVDELGLKVTGNNAAKIDYVLAGSPLEGQARGGFIIDTLTHPEGHMFSGLTSTQLKNCLNRTAGVEGRAIIVSTPSESKQVTGGTTKLVLPAMGGLEEFGIQMYGNPAIVGAVGGTSPFQGMIFRGYQVQSVGWDDGTEFRNLDALELEEVVTDSSGLAGRYMFLTNTATGSDNVVDVDLPVGKLGITLKGTPPRLTKMTAASPLNGVVNIGMTADILTLGDGSMYHEMNTMEFTGALKSTSNQAGRKVRFVQLEEVGLTPKPYAAQTDEMNVILPRGKIGVTFKGNAPCLITKVNPDSPLAGKVAPGMAVDYLTVKRRDHMELNALELGTLIKLTTDVPGRMMKLRLPSQVNEFSKVPDEIELILPTGKLGITFTGSVPIAKSFRDDSPVAGSYPPGMYVDKLVMPDGYSQSGMNTRELVNLLGQFTEEEGRCLVLRNLKTTQPSMKQVLFPNEKTVTISTGKLGLSFKGRKIARISRIHQDSKMKGLVYIHMIIDTISIPGGSTFSGMTAKEAARILGDTKNVGGRTITLKGPDSNDISIRNITTDDASIGGSSQNMSDAFTTYSEGSGMTSVRM
eukprot:CAMPEP_0194132366 /NCGR_PEP_ID=MMETSP0152-20130528/2848_1 /TAXON_ID=1049557 /ORGANISM="Thalassiothrix antarctica, Strain L6-D1" /LENGTH=766 /DNA_ID=CAMNT_0038827401 /DNA_START=56 /DNA_END=2356 /DNA_ORIENTATION=-